ncbi:uncharacterized protein LOC123524316 [Mercenaria mercenaria]|uniref:uncharacterized protein LOC123524316 n=1 Tax=Mercenaria mercenaria TaxID=6596 RepID=UPI00234E9B95|nr:uncharacterized protein LOC123524316 [Mercenaria mercenaria]
MKMHKDSDRQMDVHDQSHKNMSDNITSTTEQEKLVLNDKNNLETANTFKNVFESTLFTGNNIYFLSFASFAMIIIAIVTFIRHRQQKFAAEQKELDYLRYFHSVLPHSQIYGNLSDKFTKMDKRKNSKKSKSFRADRVEDICDADIKLNGFTSIYRRFRYSQYTSRTLSKDSSNDNDEPRSFDETEMINTELKPDVEIYENGQVTKITADANVANTGNVCQKFNFAIKTDNMQDTTVEIEESDKDMTSKSNDLTKDSRDKSGEKLVQKSKTNSSNNRVHFNLECDEKIQETETHSQTRHVALKDINITSSDEASLKRLLMENMDNMQVTAL